MAIEMREMDKIREKVIIRLDNRQIGWLVGFGLMVGGAVFTAGYVFGQKSQPEQQPDTAAPALTAEAAEHEASKPPVGGVAGQAPGEKSSAPGTAERRYTYDHVLTAPTPPVQIDDPALKILAAARKAGGDLDLAGPRPVDPAAGAPKADAADTPAGVPSADVAALKRAMAEELAEPDADDVVAEAPVEPLRGAKAAAPAKRSAPAKSAQQADSADKNTQQANASGFTIQIKAFRHKKEARQFIAVMREAGYRPYLLAAEVPGKGRFYRVRLGKFKSMSEATARQQAFEKAEGFKTIVTPL